MAELGGYVYTTKQGDMWDEIAYRVYGDEYQVGVLFAANPELLETYIFSTGCRVWCPAVESVDEEEENIPDWRDEEDVDEDETDDGFGDEEGEEDEDEEEFADN